MNLYHLNDKRARRRTKQFEGYVCSSKACERSGSGSIAYRKHSKQGRMPGLEKDRGNSLDTGTQNVWREYLFEERR